MMHITWKSRAGKLALAALTGVAIAGSGWWTQVEAKAGAAAFKDVPSSHWAYETVMWSKENGLSDGYPDGTFRPSQVVTESEFLAMLLRAYPGISLPEKQADEPWFAPYYIFAGESNWPVYMEPSRQMTRGQVAQLLAAMTGQALAETDAVQLVLDKSLAKGKQGSGVEGYAPRDVLTRAEAQTFLYRLKQLEPSLAAEGIRLKEKPALPGMDLQSRASTGTGAGVETPQQGSGVSSETPAGGSGDASSGSQSGAAQQAQEGIRLQGVAIGDTADQVVQVMGQPVRQDKAAAGMVWYIYNKDYTRYAQIGVKDGKVVALFSNGKGWQFATGDTRGLDGLTTAAGADKLWGEAEYDADYFIVYQADGSSIYLYVDKYEANRVDGVLVMEKAFDAAYRMTTPAAAELQSMEREVFDLANTFRKEKGVKTLAWNDTIAKAARLHSEDMAERNYFDHTNPDGKSAGDRMAAQGAGSFRTWGENIAAGFTDAIDAHYGWVNSSGHRANMLNEAFSTLGVGVADGGDYGIYFTQNFYTPR